MAGKKGTGVTSFGSELKNKLSSTLDNYQSKDNTEYADEVQDIIDDLESRKEELEDTISALEDVKCNIENGDEASVEDVTFPEWL